MFVKHNYNDQEKQTLRSNVFNSYQDAFAALQKYNSSKKTVAVSEKALEYRRNVMMLDY
jgi:hypothetical protein